MKVQSDQALYCMQLLSDLALFCIQVQFDLALIFMSDLALFFRLVRSDRPQLYAHVYSYCLIWHYFLCMCIFICHYFFIHVMMYTVAV